MKYYYPQLEEWLNNPNRKPAQIAFTAGLGRFIASLIEHGFDGERR